jgi:hypothetical protein
VLQPVSPDAEQTAEKSLASISSSDLRAATLGGLAAGTIDIVYAFVSLAPKGITPIDVLHSIAAGVLGKGAWDQGLPAAILGLALHYFMTFVMALLFVAAARSMAMTRNQLIAAGLVYGALIYFAMRWIVVPLSRFPGDLRVFGALDFAVHVLGVGLVIALFTRSALTLRRA